MVEQDLGRAAADAIAALIVVYMRRPGFQLQFSCPRFSASSAWDRANTGCFTRNGTATGRAAGPLAVPRDDCRALHQRQGSVTSR